MTLGTFSGRPPIASVINRRCFFPIPPFSTNTFPTSLARASSKCFRCSADFVADIAAPLPMIVIGDMLGVAPDDRDELLRWSDDMVKALGSPDPGAMDRARSE